MHPLLLLTADYESSRYTSRKHSHFTYIPTYLYQVDQGSNMIRFIGHVPRGYIALLFNEQMEIRILVSKWHCIVVYTHANVRT